MRLTNNEPKNSAINIRCNDAERAMISALQSMIRPRVSASRLMVYLCEEKAKEYDLIKYNKDGSWYIDT